MVEFSLSFAFCKTHRTVPHQIDFGVYYILEPLTEIVCIYKIGHKSLWHIYASNVMAELADCVIDDMMMCQRPFD